MVRRIAKALNQAVEPIKTPALMVATVATFGVAAFVNPIGFTCIIIGGYVLPGELWIMPSRGER